MKVDLLLCHPERSVRHVFAVEFECFVSGHDFSHADRPFIFVIPSGL